MKFDSLTSKYMRIPLILISLLFAGVVPELKAEEGAQVKLSLALLGLSKGHDGKVVIRTGEKTSEPVQLSTRYFYAPLTVRTGENRQVAIYPPSHDAKDKELKPLATFQAPTGSSQLFVVLIPKTEGYKTVIIPASDMPMGSLRITNASESPVAIQLEGQQPKKIAATGTILLRAQNPPKSQSVRMFKGSDKEKNQWDLVFSSTWHLSPDKREFCVMYPHPSGRGLRVRSLFQRQEPAPPSSNHSISPH